MSGLKQAYQDYLDDKLYQASGFGALGRDLPFLAHSFGLKP
jgi:hypothetical protein